jgi:hypothetical protein
MSSSKRDELIRERLQLAIRMAEIDDALDRLANDLPESSEVSEISEESGAE